MTIGEYIKKLRRDKGWSQRLLSYKSGLSNAAISKIETNKRIPEIDSLTSLARAFGIDRDILISIRDGSQESTYSTDDIIPAEMVNLPVVGTVRAGAPILAVENIERYMPVASMFLSKASEYYILRIKGDSMNQLFREGSFVVIERTSDIEDGNIAVVGLNGSEATIKRVQFKDDGIILYPMSHNPVHQPNFYHMEKDDVHILGKLKLSLTEY